MSASWAVIACVWVVSAVMNLAAADYADAVPPLCLAGLCLIRSTP